MASLTDKYRPKKIRDIKGNDTLKSIILRLLKKENRPQTYILQGERGCGKTTIARIMAAKLGAKGRDFEELNISNTRGIDSARAIIEKVGYMAVDGKVRVIILNEVHGAMKGFEDAMLEVLEEPPPGVYFILCTTEPERLQATVVSRCSLRNHYVKPLKRREMRELITEILDSEKVEWHKDHIVKLTRLSNGIPREAIMLLESLIELSGKRLQRAMDELQTVTSELPIALVRAIYNNEDWKSISTKLKGLGEDVDVENVRWTMLKYMRKVLLDNPNPRVAGLIECFEDSFAGSGLAGLYLACFRAYTLE